MKRLDGLDILRMFACLAVVIFHADIDVFGSTPVLNRGLHGVTVFMVLSGYLLARPYLERHDRAFAWVPYFKKRVVRIVPAYYAIVILLAALIAAGFGGAREAAALAGPLYWHVFAHLTFIHGLFAATKMSLASVLWSMSLEWQYYMLLPLLLLAFRRLHWLVVLGASIAVALAYLFVLHARFMPANEHLVDGFFLGRLPEFVFGMTLAAVLGSGEARGRRLLLAGAALCAVASAIWFAPQTHHLLVASVALLLVAAVRTYASAAVTSSGARFLRYLGGASYSTYLVHLLAGKGLLLALGDSLPPIALFTAYVIAGHVAGVGFFVLVEQPGSRLLGRLLFRPSVPSP